MANDFKANPMDMIQFVLGSFDMDDPDGTPVKVPMFSMLLGTVSDRQDPLGLGRIVAKVETFFPEGTGWLLPSNAGGKAGHGVFNPPQKGAVVAIFFPLGDTDLDAVYFPCSGWNKRSDIPGGGLVENDRTKKTFEDHQWLSIVDDRQNGEFTIRHKTTGSYVKIESSGAVTLQSTDGKLNEAAQYALVRGEKLEAALQSLKTWADAHVHADPVSGLTGPPTVSSPSVPGDLKSSNWQVD